MHALVAFVEEEHQPTSVVPLKRVQDGQDLKKGDTCNVQWTDKQVYLARIVAIGKYFLFTELHLFNLRPVCVMVCYMS